MGRLINFVRSELFLSIAGGFALGLAGIALVKPASALPEHDDSKAVVIEGLIAHAEFPAKHH